MSYETVGHADKLPALGESWEKVPSVTTGGKAHFYTRRLPDRREWWAWDRFLQSWRLTVERYATPCLVCGAPILDGIGHDAGCMADDTVGPAMYMAEIRADIEAAGL